MPDLLEWVGTDRHDDEWAAAVELIRADAGYAAAREALGDVVLTVEVTDEVADAELVPFVDEADPTLLAAVVLRMPSSELDGLDSHLAAYVETVVSLAERVVEDLTDS